MFPPLYPSGILPSSLQYPSIGNAVNFLALKVYHVKSEAIRTKNNFKSSCPSVFLRPSDDY